MEYRIAVRQLLSVGVACNDRSYRDTGKEKLALHRGRMSRPEDRDPKRTETLCEGVVLEVINQFLGKTFEFEVQCDTELAEPAAGYDGCDPPWISLRGKVLDSTDNCSSACLTLQTSHSTLATSQSV